MKQNKHTSFLFSTVGIIVMLVIVIAVCTLSSFFKIRKDFTQDKLFTLSDGTRNILSALDTPVELRFYCTQGGSDATQLFIKNYSRNVNDLLNEYTKAAKGMLTVKRYNPEPDSDAEDMARADGISGQTISTGDTLYMGIAISCLDSTVALPFLSPARERLLEYDITRAIARVASPDKVKVGILTDLPVFGIPGNPMMGQQGTQPWTFVSELERDFELVSMNSTTDSIDEDIQTLIVIHPKDLPEKTLYAIDQFVLRGGHLIAFVDPLFRLDPAAQAQQNPMARIDTASNMEKLFEAWGIKFDNSYIVADKNYISTISTGMGSIESPTILSLTSEAFSPDYVASAQIDNALMAFAGGFSGTPANGLQMNVLIKSSPNSQLVDKIMAENSQLLMKNFQISNQEFTLAAMLTGNFKTAFPEGTPQEVNSTEENSENTSDEESQKTAQTPGLKESAKPGAVILIGDVDMLHDYFSVRVSNFFGQKLIQPINGNLSLAQNLVEQMAGNENLINMRSRATMRRPFTVIQEKRVKAEEQYLSQLQELENILNETRTKINQLQEAKTDGSQQFILSEEQKTELANYRKSEADTARKLKEVRKNLRREIVSLENTLTWINTVGMATIVILIGIIIAIIKRKRTAAK